MSSVLPTVLDQHDLNKACVERLKLVALWQGYKKLPQIFSHINIIVKPADHTDDFIFEPAFADHAILVSSEMNGTFCEQASCNAHVRGGGDCTYKADKPSLFISHDTTYSQCEPACWLFGDDVVRTDLTAPDSMYLMWDGERCQFGNQGLFSYFTDPVIRSDARWEVNVNTVPTGFDTKIDSDGKLRATLNNEYCDQFNRHLSDDGLSCVRSGWQIALDYLPISSMACELVQSAIKNNWNETPAPYDKDPDPSSVHPARLDVEEWRKRIDPNFTAVKPNIRLSDIGFTAEMLHPSVRRAFYYHNKENAILRTFNMYKSVDDARTVERRNFFNRLEQSPLEQRERLPSRAYLTRVHKVKLEWLRRSGKCKNRRELLTSLHASLDMVGEDSGDDVVNPSPQDYVDQLKDMCLHLFANMPEILKTLCTDWQGMTEMASQAVILAVMKQVKGVLLKLIEGTLAKTITTVFARISSRMFVKVMSSLISTAITRITSGLVGKIMILAAKLVVAMVDWVELLQVVIAVVDIIWALLDPFGKSKYIGQDDLDNITNSFYEGLKKMGCSTYITDPLLYYNVILAQGNTFGIDNYFSTDEDASTPKLPADDGNPLEYDDDENLFYLYMAAFYYKTRTANSLGEPFEWESDVVDFSGVDVGTNIYQSMLSNSDAIAQFNNYNYMQVGVIGLLVIVLLLFLLFLLTGLAVVGLLAGAAVFAFIFSKFCVDGDAQTVAYKSIRQSLGVVDDLPENC